MLHPSQPRLRVPATTDRPLPVDAVDDDAQHDEAERRFWTECLGDHAWYWLATGAMPVVDWPPPGMVLPPLAWLDDADGTTAPTGSGAPVGPEGDGPHASMAAHWRPVAAGPALSRWRRLLRRG